jgi:tetratricopeptide (TPR) repeat protein
MSNSRFTSEALTDVLAETRFLLGKAEEELQKIGLKDWKPAEEFAKILSAASDQPTFDVVHAAVERALSDTNLFTEILQHLLAAVKAHEVRRARRQRFGAQWWKQRSTDILKAFQDDSQAGVAVWADTLVECLAASQFESCATFLGEEYPLPQDQATRLELVRAGVQAIQKLRYSDPAVSEMLAWFVQAKFDRESHYVLSAGARAALFVFQGRIHLYHSGNKDAAIRQFEEARQTAPDKALPSAALGEYKRAFKQIAEAEGFFMEAVEKGANEPHGYLGLGLCAADQKKWNEADLAFDRVVQCVQDERDALGVLTGLDAPVSGRAVLRLACALAEIDKERALDAIEQALIRGVDGPGSNPEAEAYRLKGDVLVGLGRESQAAAPYFEAGRRFNWSRNPQAAKEALLKAFELNPDHLPTRWQLADTWMAISLNTSSAAEKDAARDALESAEATWNAALRERAPDVDHYWIYLTGALIKERTLDFAGQDWRKKVLLLLQAVAYVERSLLLVNSRDLAWDLLSLYYRKLGLYQNALAANSRALELDPADKARLEDRLVILVNSGDFERASEEIEKSSNIETNPWAKNVKAFIRSQLRDYDSAIRLIQEASGAEPTQIWVLEARADAYEMAGLREQAASDWNRIYQMAKDDGSGESLSSQGWAAFRLGDYEAAINLATSLLEDPIQRYDANQLLVTCYLNQQDMENARLHLDGSVHRSNPKQLRNWWTANLEPLQARIPDQLYRDIQSAIDDRIRSAPLTQEAELQEALSLFNADEAEADWKWVGIQASLARVMGSQERHQEATSIYRRLVELRHENLPMFPEALIAIANQIERMREKGDSLFKGRRPQEAIADYMLALSLAEQFGHADSSGAIESRIGYAYFTTGDPPRTREYLSAALGNDETNSIQCGTIVGESIRALLPDLREYHRIENELKAWQQDAGPQFRTALSAARKSLATYLDDYFELKATNPLLPIITPVAVELSKDLIPEDNSEADWSFRESYLPRMRDRILQDMGVRVPDVEIRKMDDHSRSNSYVIVLNEMTSIVHTVERSADPLTEIGDRLEAVLRAHLPDFVGLQETVYLLKDWSRNPGISEQAREQLSDWESCIRLTRLLRALLQDRVPITKPDAILEAMEQTGVGDDVSLQLARLRLKDVLPGNRPGDQRITVPQDFEDDIWVWLDSEGGRQFLAAPPEYIIDWLAQIRTLISSADGSTQGAKPTVVLITRQADLRLPLRRLVELEFPAVMMLSEEEVLDLTQTPVTPGKEANE